LKRDKVLNLRDPPNSWRDQIINASILSGLQFFTSLAGIGAAGLLADWKLGILAAGIAAGLTFFSSLALQRGLVKKGE